jgi:hypothetical protein
VASCAEPYGLASTPGTRFCALHWALVLGPMSYPPEIYHRDEGEVSARLVRADTPPDIVYSQSGNRVRLLATGGHRRHRRRRTDMG